MVNKAEVRIKMACPDINADVDDVLSAFYANKLSSVIEAILRTMLIVNIITVHEQYRSAHGYHGHADCHAHTFSRISDKSRLIQVNHLAEHRDKRTKKSSKQQDCSMNSVEFKEEVETLENETARDPNSAYEKAIEFVLREFEGDDDEIEKRY